MTFGSSYWEVRKKKQFEKSGFHSTYMYYNPLSNYAT